MQPCGVCGGLYVDAAGSCTTCGTYRGPAYGTPAPTSGPPTSGPPMSPPYPGSAPPYPASPPPYQGSAPPYSGSAPPYQAGTQPYPTAQAGGWPAYPAGAPAPARTRSPLVIPLLALSAVLLIITAAIVFIAVLRHGSGKEQVTPP